MSMEQTFREPLGIKARKDFPGGPVANTLCFQCVEHGYDPWSGNYPPSHMLYDMAKTVSDYFFGELMLLNCGVGEDS